MSKRDRKTPDQVESTEVGEVETNPGEFNTDVGIETAQLITTEQTVPETAEEVSPAELVSGLLKKHSGSKSAVVRELHGVHGMKTGDIVKAMNAAGVKSKNGNDFIYQHARNILNQKVKSVA